MRRLGMIFILSMPFASNAIAQDANSAVKITKECRHEVMTLCPDSETMKARRACVILNGEKLSKPCQAELKARFDNAKLRQELRKAGAKNDNIPPPTAAPH